MYRFDDWRPQYSKFFHYYAHCLPSHSAVYCQMDLPVAYSCSTRWVPENIQVSIEYPGTRRVPYPGTRRVPGYPISYPIGYPGRLLPGYGGPNYRRYAPLMTADKFAPSNIPQSKPQASRHHILNHECCLIISDPQLSFPVPSLLCPSPVVVCKT